MSDYLYGEPEPVTGPVCPADGTIERDDGSEFYWHCGQPGTITVDGALLCEDHAGELGYGPRQEEYGFDPDGTPGTGRTEPMDTTIDACPACGSEVHAEIGLVPGFTGMPVSCPDEWHDEED